MVKLIELLIDWLTARALYRDPSILVMDEASSALDSQNEHLIQESLSSLAESGKKKTIIIIAHRLSTIKNAGKILVVKDGRIIQCGTHNELINNKDGEYFHLVQRQLFQK